MMYCNPLWCEDCKAFICYGPDGEGECAKGQIDVWYGKPVCDKFEPKDGNAL